MTTLLTLVRKELRHYFNSPIAYVILIIYLAISGYFFAANLFVQDILSMRAYLQTTQLILLFIIPPFAMRLIAEEKKQGTLELMLTMPISDLEVVIGKFIGAVAFYAVMVGLTLVYPIVLATLGSLDWGPVIGGYAGVFLMGTALVAAGLFASSLTSNQVVALLIGFAFAFALFMMGKVVDYVPSFAAGLVAFLGFDSHFANISKGIIDSRDLLYYFSLCFLMLYLTYLSLLNRKK